MFAKLSRLNCQDMQRTLAPTPRTNATNSQVQCLNPKCGKPGHTFEQCWAEGGRSYKGRRRGGRGRQLQASGTLKDSTKVVTSSDAKVEVLLAYATNQSIVSPAIHLHEWSIHMALLTNDQPHYQTHRLEWIIDSGATVHLCRYHDWFTSYCPLNPPCKIILGNKNLIFAPGISQIEVHLRTRNSPDITIICNILFCPNISHNLLSVPQLMSTGT